MILHNNNNQDSEEDDLESGGLSSSTARLLSDLTEVKSQKKSSSNRYLKRFSKRFTQLTTCQGYSVALVSLCLIAPLIYLIVKLCQEPLVNIPPSGVPRDPFLIRTSGSDNVYDFTNDKVNPDFCKWIPTGDEPKRMLCGQHLVNAHVKPTRLTPERVEKMRWLLRTTARLFEKGGIEYLLDAGTLLGAVRFGDFLRWDDDIDILVHRDHLQLIEAMAIDLEKERVRLSTTRWGWRIHDVDGEDFPSDHEGDPRDTKWPFLDIFEYHFARDVTGAEVVVQGFGESSRTETYPITTIYPIRRGGGKIGEDQFDIPNRPDEYLDQQIPSWREGAYTHGYDHVHEKKIRGEMFPLPNRLVQEIMPAIVRLDDIDSHVYSPQARCANMKKKNEVKVGLRDLDVIVNHGDKYTGYVQGEGWGSEGRNKTRPVVVKLADPLLREGVNFTSTPSNCLDPAEIVGKICEMKAVKKQVREHVKKRMGESKVDFEVIPSDGYVTYFSFHKLVMLKRVAYRSRVQWGVGREHPVTYVCDLMTSSYGGDNLVKVDSFRCVEDFEQLAAYLRVKKSNLENVD
eukprot:Nk52_evm5s277 gene=Nk52_evmTU5s277